MEGAVLVKTYDFPDLNEIEILRYAQADESNISMLRECLAEIDRSTKMKVCYSCYSLQSCDGQLDLGFVKTASGDLAKCLEGCGRFVVFAATAGIQFDKLIRKYATVSQVKSLFFQAIGTECAEALCEAFCNDLACNYRITPRFSPGYGDLSLRLQKDIMNILDCQRKVGITLNDSLLMTPTKSVTAFVGIKG